MNKRDLIFITIILVISIVLYFMFNKSNNYAYVYYDNSLVLTIDLSKDESYKVKGYNGDVYLEVKDNKIRVKEEVSNNHLCSKKGFTNTGSIVCLPNKVIITFDNENLDTRVG